MTSTLHALPIVALFALAACEPVPVVETPPLPPAEDACGASAFQGLVGQDASVLASMTFPEPMRVYTQGDALTMDFNPGRLNVELDASDTIARVWCG